MTQEQFDRYVLHLKISDGALPPLTGHHLSKEQYDEIVAVLQKRKENIERYLNTVVKCRLIKKL
jgi:hypothetical protein